MSWRWNSECKVWVGRAHLAGARWLLYFATGAEAERAIKRAEADDGGEQRHRAEGADPVVIDDALGDEAEAKEDAEGAIDTSDVGFHMCLGSG